MAHSHGFRPETGIGNALIAFSHISRYNSIEALRDSGEHVQIHEDECCLRKCFYSTPLTPLNAEVFSRILTSMLFALYGHTTKNVISNF